MYAFIVSKQVTRLKGSAVLSIDGLLRILIAFVFIGVFIQEKKRREKLCTSENKDKTKDFRSQETF